MNLRPALAILVLFLSITSTCSSATLSSAVEEAIAQGQSEVNILVTFKDTQSMDVLSSSASNEEKIRAMKENASSSRQAFIKTFAARTSDIRKFWIFNGVALTASAEVIKDMANNEFIKKIELDGVEQLPPTVMSEGTPRGEWTYGLEKINVPQMRAQYGLLGDGVTVGVIDTGVDPDHPDLVGKVIGFKDMVNNRTDAYDDQGHGTHCSGTIAGGKASGTHIGVAPNAKLIVAKAFSSSGSAQSSWLLGAMQYMADPDGNPATNDAPSIVSNSWGGGSGNTTYLEATKNWLALGIFPSFAAGNSGPGAGTVGTPGGFLESFAVGATNASDGIAYFSSRGPVTWNGQQHIKPDVSAPGHDVYSAKPGGGYTKMSGTSMACPHVSGLIALIHQASPGISINDVRALLEETAKDLGDTGKDNTFGSGRINALAAMEIAVSGGRLIGKLIDVETNKPLLGTVKVIEKNISIKTDGTTGGFLTTLPEGDYTLQASAFGYRDGEPQTVTLVASEETNVVLSLERAATGTLVGVVKGGDSGVAVPAKIRVLDVPVAPVDTADGNFEFVLPGGTYKIMVTAFGYATFTSEPITVAENGSVEFEANLAPLPPILLVDDDKGKKYEEKYKSALTALNKEFDVIDVKKAGQLELMDILGYETLVWFTGDDYQSTLTDKDCEILAEYLKSGGRLLLSGQDVGYDLKKSAFYRDYLKAKFVKDDAGVRKIKGQGLSFGINQKYPDNVEALAGATVFFEYEGANAAGLLVNDLPGKVLYLSFGIEAITSDDKRLAVMEKGLAAVEPTALDSVARLSLLEDEACRIRWAEVCAPKLDNLSAEQLNQLNIRLGGRGSSPAVRDLLRTVRNRLR